MCIEVVFIKTIINWTIQMYKSWLYLQYLHWGRDQFETDSEKLGLLLHGCILCLRLFKLN